MTTSADRLVDALRASLTETENLRRQNKELVAALSEPVAIVGMACRYPGGVRTPEDLWHLVTDEVDAMSSFPGDRGWDLDALSDPESGSYVQEGGFVHSAAEFDAEFFRISPREALAMDPQQRVVLQAAWEAIERAGIDAASLKGTRTGVFIGAGSPGYATDLKEIPQEVQGYTLTGLATSVVSGRIAYTLGLEGPAVTVDTACSSSLVALHLAVQSLRQGECGLALAGGVTIMSSPGVFQEFSRQRGLAPDGRCKAFAAAADGTGWAEGVGVLLIERLSDARRNGHRVLAVVRGSAVNQDGASNGLTAPNGPSQQRVIRQALDNARLTTDQIDLLEAHGTGTTLGDPIEAQALLATYGQGRATGRPLWLGSLKSNIGHAQAASGVGGVVKLVMALQHGVLPKTLHVDEPTPHVDWESGAVSLLTEARPWPETGEPRRGAVSSFGVSGTNAHVIIEQAEPAPAVPTEPPPTGAPVPWVLTARDGDSLIRVAQQTRAFLENRPHLGIREIGGALAGSRAALEHRAVVVGADRAELLAGLDAVVAGTPAVSGVAESASASRPVFVFPGQGAQWAGMGVELAEAFPVFADALAECAEALRPVVGWDLLAELSGDLSRVEVVQPASWAVMVSLARLWESFGVTPAAVVGHSQGEIAAAVVAGALSLEDGARVVGLRSKVIASRLAGKGAMAAVALPVGEVRAALTGGVAVAAVNAESSVVISGDPGEVDALVAAWDAAGVRVRRVAVDYASHSAQVEVLRAELLRVLESVTARASVVPFYSTVTGGVLDTATMDAGYWYRNLRQTVEFASTVEVLRADGFDTFIECSSHPVLTLGIPEAVGSLRRDDGGARRFVTSLAEAYVAGVPVVLTGLVGDGPAVDLPTYPFQRSRYWLHADPAQTPTRTDADEVEARFWEAVEREDLESLAGSLRTDQDDLERVLPALSGWRRRHREHSTIDSWRYKTAWRPVAESGTPVLSGTWLLAVAESLTDAPWHDAAETALRAHGARVVRLPLDAGAGRDYYTAVLRATLAATPDVTGVLSLLPLDDRPHPEHPATVRGLTGTLAMAQALGDVDIDAPFWCATRGAVSVGASDPLTAAAQATVWGLGRVVAEESPHRWGGLIDLPAVADSRAGARLAAVLAGLDDEDQVAIRRSGVYANRLIRADWGDGRPRRDWRPDGTVLVTGGTGALGGHVARWLAACGAPHLLLLSSRGPDAPGADDLRRELTELGARVTISACDVADRAALAAVLADVPAEYPLRAVVHTAAVLDDGVLDALTPGQLDRVLRVKALGAVHLDELTRDLDLTAFVLFSSFAGTFGVAGQGNYAPGNAFLDALARARRAGGRPATSIAWGHWSGGGIASGAAEAQLRRRGGSEIDPPTALRALGEVLDHDETVVALALIEWERIAAGARELASRPRPFLRELTDVRRLLAGEGAATGPTPAAGGTPLADRLAALPEAERDRAVLDLVRGQVAAVLGHGSPDAVHGGRPFRELGFDSLTSVELRNRLSTVTGLKLPATVVFDHPTPDALARHLRAIATGGNEPAGVAEPPTPAAANGDDPVVIVGMSCRLPGGADTPDDLWQLIADERDAVGGLPTDRGWDVETLVAAGVDVPGMRFVRQGGFLRDAASFDAGFFGIPDHEALAMDPQHRLLLEMSWEAIERAGIAPRTLSGESVGVFVGTFSQGYWTGMQEVPEETRPHLSGGISPALAAGRIAYALGLEGPVLTLDTGCSSSAVALHLAVQAVRAGECDLALAGGASVLANPAVSPDMGVGAAGDGRCKSYSEAADGTGWGEGAGVLVVERLSVARRAGHPVLAVIRGTAVNHNGGGNGLGAPNGPSQRRVIRQALTNAGLTPADVDVVEGHGTGTPLGDPIEAEALMAVYGAGRDPSRPLWLGTVKSNLGHPQAASGVVGVIKTVQSMRYGILPRSLHSDEPSGYVDWTAGGVRLLTKTVPWPVTGRPRRAGVSSFGASGTKVHVILEQGDSTEQVDRPERTVTNPPQVVPVVLSARDGVALRAQAARLHGHLAARPALAVADVAWTQAVGRSVHPHRTVLLATGRAGLLDGLAAVAAGHPDTTAVSGEAPPNEPAVTCVFPGEPVDAAAVRRLHATYRPFADAVDVVAAHLDPVLDRPLLDVLLDAGEQPPAPGSMLAHAASLAVEYAQFTLLRYVGVPVTAVTGRGPGAVAAALAAEAIGPQDAARLLTALAEGRPAPADGWRTPVLQVLSPTGPDDLADAWDADTVTVAEDGVTVRAGVPDDGVLRTLAALHVAGAPVDWARVLGTAAGRLVDLPTYPFQRERYWLRTPLDGLLSGAAAE
ncbi:type I polyketide synthase [Micromonospora sp. NPDC049101]|uniref:type I polyketide synthase n=1 Tax=Micromonospora sp. NPDC049101 TaxID=3155032 RepID=UPI0033EABA29